MIQLILLLLNVLTISIAVMLIVWSWPSRRKMEAIWLMVFALSLCIVTFCTMNVYVQNSFENKILFSRLRFFGFAWLGLSWMIFFTSAFGGWSFLKKWPALTLLLTPSVITSLITLIPSLNHLMVDNFSPYRWANMDLVEFRGGAWFPFHLTIVYVAVSFALVYGINRYRFLSSLQKRQLLFVLSGAFLGLAIDMYCVATNNPLRWAMLSSSSYIVSIGAILYSVLNQGLLDISPLAKEKIFREFPEPVIIIDDNDSLQDYNRAAQNLFNLTNKDLEKSWNSLQKKIGIILSDNEREVSIFNDSYSPRYFSLSVDKLEEYSIRHGKILFFREITNQKNVEAKLNNHLEFKARLLSMIAHDFSGFLDAQRVLSTNLEKQVQPELRSHAGALADSVFASKDFMANIILWAKSQENKFEPIKRPFEINILIQDVINSLEAHIDLHQVAIQFIPIPSPIIINGDGVMIESVVRNLLHNAIRISTPNKKIFIKIKLDIPQFVTVEIQDQGNGMTEAQIQAIHQSYNSFSSKVSEERDVHGLGLAIVQRFLELHDGRFSIESKLGEGTLVSFSLPL